ncbi:hypothetical protein K432DRAFT_380442 [Lepidopterella palustris CBS 459.81]|uniref:VanZ-like domain-containing protein n=1 Tax=Lepidopterella palustris CBS 459.81 TaxID=1314670 RepID=A0A8E2EEQ4_9PEZI|nr:hypothetical protein K432DRAFT_380442 [Lepidopterella palustris CBS 459.81]
MRIRKPFAGAFAGVCLIAALAGFSSSKYSLPAYKESDKALHFVCFFLLTITFYWILETNRRRVLQFTFIVCPLCLGFGSEILQGLLPNDREFDYYDILANVLGSLFAITICNWYHKRMLERKRAARGYHAVVGDDTEGLDVELGEGIGTQESGVARPGTTPTVEQELDNWDENAEDWEETEPTEHSTNEQGPNMPSSSGDLGVADIKKRND